MSIRQTLGCPAEAIFDAIFGIAYAVDGDGFILRFSRGPFLNDERDGKPVPWDCSQAIGKNIFSKVNGEEVRQSFQALHEAVWNGRQTAVGFEYRCDAPEIERKMHMSLSLISDERTPVAVLYQSIVISETPRVPMPLFAADTLTGRREAKSGEPIVKLCSYCQKVGAPMNGLHDELEWIEPADYYRRGGGTEISISHAVCGSCFDRVIAPVLRSGAGGDAPRREDHVRRTLPSHVQRGSPR